MAKAREIEGLEDDLPFREAAARALETRAEELFEHAPRVLDTSDIEGVHDMRVATRRLRAVLELFEPSFPPRQWKRDLKQVKRLADALGERRDPDVMIDRLRRIESGFTQEDRPGIESLVAELRAGQEAANERLERMLAQIEDDRLRPRLALLAAEARG